MFHLLPLFQMWLQNDKHGNKQPPTLRKTVANWDFVFILFRIISIYYTDKTVCKYTQYKE